MRSLVKALESLLTSHTSKDLKIITLRLYKKAASDAELLDKKEKIEGSLVVPIGNVYSRFEQYLYEELESLDLLSDPKKICKLKAAIQSWDPGDLDEDETSALGMMENFLRETVLDRLYNQQYQQYIRYTLRKLMLGITASTELLKGKKFDLYLGAENSDLTADKTVDAYLQKDPIYSGSKTLGIEQSDNPVKNKKIDIITAAIVINNKLLHTLEEKIISRKPITPRNIERIEEKFARSTKRNVISRLHAYDSERSFFQLFIEFVSDTLTSLFNLNRNLSTKGTVVNLLKTNTLLFSATKRKSQATFSSERGVERNHRRLP